MVGTWQSFYMEMNREKKPWHVSFHLVYHLLLFFFKSKFSQSCKNCWPIVHHFCFPCFPCFFFSFFSLSTTVMVNWWFGARLFGSLGSPKMKGVVNEGHPDSNPKPPGPKPPNVPSRKLTYPTKRERKIAQKCEKDVSVFCKSFAGFKF